MYLASQSDSYSAKKFKIEIVTPTGWYDLDFFASRMVNERFNSGVSGNLQLSRSKTFDSLWSQNQANHTHLQEEKLHLDSFLNKPFYSCEGLAFEASLFDAPLSVTSH
jgi:hypothetical protein